MWHMMKSYVLPVPLPPLAVPAEPSISDLTASSTALTVTWTNTDTGIEVDSYEVAVLDANSQVASTSVGSSVTTASLNVTCKGVTYTLNVAAVNKVGPSSLASTMFYFAGKHPSEKCLGGCGVCCVQTTLWTERQIFASYLTTKAVSAVDVSYMVSYFHSRSYVRIMCPVGPHSYLKYVLIVYYNHIHLSLPSPFFAVYIQTRTNFR